MVRIMDINKCMDDKGYDIFLEKLTKEYEAHKEKDQHPNIILVNRSTHFYLHYIARQESSPFDVHYDSVLGENLLMFLGFIPVVCSYPFVSTRLFEFYWKPY